jgi:hypothetical protein
LPSEPIGAAPHFGKGIPHTSKNRPAYADTHIGHEENYLKCSSTRLKCNFGLSGALFFNDLQTRKKWPSKPQFPLFFILTGGVDFPYKKVASSPQGILFL